LELKISGLALKHGLDLRITAHNRRNDTGDSPDFLLQCGREQLEKEILFTLVSSVVVQRQYCRLHELGRAARRQRKHQSCQVDGFRL